MTPRMYAEADRDEKEIAEEYSRMVLVLMGERSDYIHSSTRLKLEFQRGEAGHQRLAGIDLPQPGTRYQRSDATGKHDILRKWRAVDEAQAVVGANAGLDIRLKQQQFQ